MQVETRLYINSRPYLKKYLKEHSYWYKFLNRDSLLIKKMEEEMEEKYKLRTEDRIERLGESIEMISNIISVFK